MLALTYSVLECQFCASLTSQTWLAHLITGGWGAREWLLRVVQDGERGRRKGHKLVLRQRRVLPEEACQAVLGAPGGLPGPYQLPAGPPVQAPGPAPLAVAAVVMTQLPLKTAAPAWRLMH